MDGPNMLGPNAKNITPICKKIALKYNAEIVLVDFARSLVWFPMKQDSQVYNLLQDL